MDKKKLRNDLILIASLLIVAVVSLVCVLASRNTKNTLAKVYVQNELVLSVDLSKKEEKSYEIHGLNGDLIVETNNKGEIAITKSNCPHQDCVRMGFIKESNHPIICAYNATYIVIEGNASYDVVI